MPAFKGFLMLPGLADSIVYGSEEEDLLRKYEKSSDAQPRFTRLVKTKNANRRGIILRLR